MVGLRRYERVTRLAGVDTPVTLIEANWFLTTGRGVRFGGYSYRAPASVVVDGMPPVRIHDHVMLARLLAASVTAILILRAFRSQRK
jgi:hypothetical protein